MHSSVLRRYRPSRSVAAIFAAAFIAISLFPLHTNSQDTDKKKKDDQKKQDRTIKAVVAADKQQAKRERRYQKIVVYAEEKYGKDPQFKEVIDDRYRALRQEHTREAYAVNMRPSNYKMYNRDGEKIRFEQALYDNPLAQDYVNRVGQSLVPQSSKKLYAFRIIQNPVPEARALSTGTVYISTGYLAVIDNEAQLAYILGHEIAHVEKDHWRKDILVEIATPSYEQKKETFITIFKTALMMAKEQGLDGVIAASVLKLAGIDETFQWESLQEDEADIEGMKYMFERNYDVREIPKLYARMLDVTKDPRLQTGFISDPERIKDRLETYQSASQPYMKEGAAIGAADLAERRGKNISLTGAGGIARMLNETLAPEIKRKLEANELIASSEEFQSVMALVKRDNGIRAFQFDMFELARNNLKESIEIRSNDPAAYYYYGKVLKQTARNASEMSLALKNLQQAIQADKRQTIAEPYLFQAMLRLAERNPNEMQRIAQDLQKYVEIYQRENGGALPPNMEFIYDVMQDFGQSGYRAVPAMNTADAPRMIPGTRIAAEQPATQAPPAATVPEKTQAPRTARAKGKKPGN